MPCCFHNVCTLIISITIGDAHAWHFVNARRVHLDHALNMCVELSLYWMIGPCECFALWIQVPLTTSDQSCCIYLAGLEWLGAIKNQICLQLPWKNDAYEMAALKLQAAMVYKHLMQLVVVYNHLIANCYTYTAFLDLEIYQTPPECLISCSTQIHMDWISKKAHKLTELQRVYQSSCAISQIHRCSFIF